MNDHSLVLFLLSHPLAVQHQVFNQLVMPIINQVVLMLVLLDMMSLHLQSVGQDMIMAVALAAFHRVVTNHPHRIVQMVVVVIVKVSNHRMVVMVLRIIQMVSLMVVIATNRIHHLNKYIVNRTKLDI
jgi:hypothetical protein